MTNLEAQSTRMAEATIKATAAIMAITTLVNNDLGRRDSGDAKPFLNSFTLGGLMNAVDVMANDLAYRAERLQEALQPLADQTGSGGRAPYEMPPRNP